MPKSELSSDHVDQAGYCYSCLQTFAGNTNDVDIVEHMLNLDCKYIVFKPSQYDQSICAEIFIYSSQGMLPCRHFQNLKNVFCKILRLTLLGRANWSS